MNILIDIIIILFFNFLFLWILSYFKIPEIISLLIAGVIIGPYGIKFIKEMEHIEIISEIGIILLLFTIGIEFSFKELKKHKKDILVVGFFQVFITIVFIALLFSFFYDPLISLLFGIIVSISSTAIVLKILEANNELQSPYGKVIISVQIFQDLVSIVFVMILPYLSKIDSNSNFILYIKNFYYQSFILKLFSIVIMVFLLYKYIIPFVFFQIAKVRNKDLFVLTIITFVFFIAFSTSKLGLSVAFGAFLAGLLISETQYSHESINNIVPFKIIFTSIFFTSIGMMVNLDFFISNYNWIKILSLSFLFVLIKFMIAAIIILFIHKNLRIAIITSLSLAQIGEFSFIILKISYNSNLINNNIYQILLISSVITMILTPFLMKISHPLSFNLMKILEHISQIHKISYLQKFLHKQDVYNLNYIKELSDHIIIIGYGVNGKNVAKAARIVDIPYIIIELNIKTVQNELKKGESIIYGDATNPNLLEYINIKKAKLLVIVINDFKTTQYIIQIAKGLNPDIYIIARTRYILEVPSLFKAGANQVIPEEFETSIQIFKKILEHYNFSFPEIQFFIEELRLSGYEILRNDSL